MTAHGTPFPRLVMVGITVTGLMLFILFPKLQLKLGILSYGRWFLDSYAILATNDAIQAGLDPYQPNPLDDLHRQHSYSHWWFLLGRCGVTRADNFVFGGLCVLAYLVIALAGLRPRTFGQSVWYALLMLAPPFLLAVMRANNDLVVFAVLGAGAMLLHRPSGWRWLVVLAAVGLATGLKFYPAVAAVGLLLLRPIRRFWQGLLTTSVVLALIITNIWADFGRAVIPVPTGVYSFGASLLLNDLSWLGRSAQIGAASLLLMLGIVFRHRGLTVGLAVDDEQIADRLRFLWAGILLLACFLGGISYAYRWIFALWCAPWLWTIMHENQKLDQRLGARWASALLIFCVWSDGLFCLVINLFFTPISPATFDSWRLYWRLFAQPPVWLLMGMLTGWLLDALLVTMCEVRLRVARE